MALEETATTAEVPPEAPPAVGDTESAAATVEDTAGAGSTDEGTTDTDDEGKLLAQLPPPIRSAYNKLITTKTQAIAEDRKRVEKYGHLVDSFEKDPVGTAKALAEHLGVIQKSTPAAEATDSVLTELSEIVGEDEARRLAPAFEKLAKRVLESEIGPIKKQQELNNAKMAQEQTASILKSFGEKHPGWEKHETKMQELGTRLQPNGMEPSEYLETLYYLSTRDIQSAEQTKRLAEKFNQAAQAAEPVASGVNANRVSATPPAFKTPHESWEAAVEAAKKGVVW